MNLQYIENIKIENIKPEFERVSKKLASDLVERDLLLKRMNEYTDKRNALKQRVEDSKSARIVLQEVSRLTMKNLEYHLSNLVTLALKSINPEWPTFVAEIVIRRNQMECDLLFEEEGVRYKPTDGAGGGPLDVASFALRCTFWSLDKNRACLLLDEPFKFVSPDLQEKTSDMIKMISESLKLQIILISHQEYVNASADKTYRTEKVGRITTIKEEEI